MKKIILLASMMLLANGCTYNSTNAGNSAAFRNEIRRISIQSEIDKTMQLLPAGKAIPGMAVGFFDEESEPVFAVKGVTSIEDRHNITLEMYWHLGSNAKAMSADIAMKLVEENKINLDSPIANYLPWISGSMNNGYAGLSLREVLSHRAGLPAFTSIEDLSTIPSFQGSLSEKRAEFVGWVTSNPPLQRGEYLYSNAGWIVLSSVIEAVTEQTWEEVFVRSITHGYGADPWIGLPTGLGASQPAGHFDPFGTGLIVYDPFAFPMIPNYLAPAGNVSMKATDYGKYLQAHLRGMLGTNGYLSARSYQTIHQNPVDTYFGGWETKQIDGHPVQYHLGSLGMYTTIAIIDPVRKRGAFAMINSNSPEQEAALDLMLISILNIK